MPYTNTWTTNYPAPTSPAGDPANTNTQGVAHDIRRLKLDFQERMSSIVEDWFADPVKLLPTSTSLGYTRGYNLTEGPNGVVIKALLLLDVKFETTLTAIYTLNLDNLDESYDLSKLVGWQAYLWNNDDNDAIFPVLDNIDYIIPSLRFSLIDEDGTLQSNKEVEGRFIFLFSEVPAS